MCFNLLKYYAIDTINLVVNAKHIYDILGSCEYYDGGTINF